MKRAVVYIAIRGDPTSRFYVYRYVVVSPTREEGCGVVCSGCGGDKVWYIAILKVLKEVLPKYGKVEIRTHFTHIPKDIFRMKLSERVEVKYVDEKDNLALKGIDKCLAKKMAQPATTHQPPAEYSQPPAPGDLHSWQNEFRGVVKEALSRGVPVVVLSAPTGSGKTKAVLEAAKFAVDRGLASLVVAVGRTKTQQEAFIRDNEQFGIGFMAVRLPSKIEACEQIRVAQKPPDDWDEEEKKEYSAMLARKTKCGSCPLNFFTSSIRLDALKRVVVEATNKMRNADDNLYVDELKDRLREEIQKERGPAEAERGNVCAYSAVKTATAYMVAKGEPVLSVGTYPHVLSRARVLLLNICRGDTAEEEEELDSVEKNIEEPKCRAVVVIDEAHNLWKEVKDFNKYSISDKRILNVAKDLAAYCKDNPEESWCVKFNKQGGIDRILRHFTKTIGKLVEVNSSRKARRDGYVKVPEQSDIPIEVVLEGLLAVLEEVCKPYLDEFGKLTKDDMRIARAYMLMKTVKRFLNVLGRMETGWGIYSIIDKGRKSLVLLPIDLRGIIDRARETFHGLWILLSGTINRSEVEDLFGRVVRFYSASSVKFGRLAVQIAVSRDVDLLTTRHDERNESMYKKYAVATPRVLHGAAGPLRLVAYTSYSVMKSVRKHYVPPGGTEERWERRGEKFKREIEKLLEEGKLVNLHAVAQGSFVEGIEFKLDDGRSAIGTVVVVGIPIPKIFDDYHVDVARHFGYLDRRCAEELHRAPNFADAPEKCKAKLIEWGYTLAETALKQIIGRAIRGPQDSATLYLLDTRIAVVPRLRDALCRGLHYHVECSEIPAEELINAI